MISVIICTYDRYDLVEKSLLSAFSSLNQANIPFELLVIENTPEEKRKPIELPNDSRCKLIISERPGLSIARNLGIKKSTGDIVCFLDDDAICHAEWAAALNRAVKSNPNAMVFGGRVLAAFEDGTKPSWFYESLQGYFSCIDWGESDLIIKPGQWLVGANIAFRRNVFETYGTFDEGLGRKGNNGLLSNEETELFKKIGLDKVLYVSAAIVDHYIPTNRVTLGWLRKRVYWQAVSDLLSGEFYLSAEQALRELNNLMPRLPAECRGIKALGFSTENPKYAEMQLRAVYLTSLLAGMGEPFTQEGDKP